MPGGIGHERRQMHQRRKTRVHDCQQNGGQAGLQIENSEIGLKGSRNAVLPELDLVGIVMVNKHFNQRAFAYICNSIVSRLFKFYH